MSNVFAFKRPEVKAPAQTLAAATSQTLFIHVKNATMIAHLGKPQPVETNSGARLG